MTSPSSPRPLSSPGGAVQPFFNWNPQAFLFIEQKKVFSKQYFKKKEEKSNEREDNIQSQDKNDHKKSSDSSDSEKSN